MSTDDDVKHPDLVMNRRDFDEVAATLPDDVKPPRDLDEVIRDAFGPKARLTDLNEALKQTIPRELAPLDGTPEEIADWAERCWPGISRAEVIAAVSGDAKPPRDPITPAADLFSSETPAESADLRADLSTAPNPAQPLPESPSEAPDLLDLLPPGWLGRWNKSSLTRLARQYVGLHARVWTRAASVQIGIERNGQKVILAIGGDYESAWRALCLAAIRERARMEQASSQTPPRPAPA